MDFTKPDTTLIRDLDIRLRDAERRLSLLEHYKPPSIEMLEAGHAVIARCLPLGIIGCELAQAVWKEMEQVRIAQVVG